MINTRKEAKVTFVSKVSMIFIILFRVFLKLTDWKSVVLLDTKRIGTSSIDGHVEK